MCVAHHETDFAMELETSSFFSGSTARPGHRRGPPSIPSAWQGTNTSVNDLKSHFIRGGENTLYAGSLL